MLIVDAAMNLPLKREEPVNFQGIQLSDRDAADFGPRLVLEGIIVKELASQKEGDSEPAGQLAAARGVHPSRRKHAHPRSQIVQAQKDGRTWQAS